MCFTNLRRRQKKLEKNGLNCRLLFQCHVHPHLTALSSRSRGEVHKTVSAYLSKHPHLPARHLTAICVPVVAASTPAGSSPV